MKPIKYVRRKLVAPDGSKHTVLVPVYGMPNYEPPTEPPPKRGKVDPQLSRFRRNAPSRRGELG